MSSKTAPNSQKAILTFNVFFREDTTTLSFLPSIVSKDPCHWAVFRSVFAGRKDCKLTIVDKSVTRSIPVVQTWPTCRSTRQRTEMSFCNSASIRL